MYHVHHSKSLAKNIKIDIVITREKYQNAQSMCNYLILFFVIFDNIDSLSIRNDTISQCLINISFRKQITFSKSILVIICIFSINCIYQIEKTMFCLFFLKFKRFVFLKKKYFGKRNKELFCLFSELKIKIKLKSFQ